MMRIMNEFSINRVNWMNTKHVDIHIEISSLGQTNVKDSRVYLMYVAYRKSLVTNWKKALSKWQLADLFVIKTTQRPSLMRITRINFHFTYRWVFAAEWSSMGNPPGCKLPRNMLPIVRVKSEIDTHQGKEDHWKCCAYRPLKVRILALVRERKSVAKEQK